MNKFFQMKKTDEPGTSLMLDWPQIIKNRLLAEEYKIAEEPIVRAGLDRLAEEPYLFDTFVPNYDWFEAIPPPRPFIDWPMDRRIRAFYFNPYHYDLIRKLAADHNLAISEVGRLAIDIQRMPTLPSDLQALADEIWHTAMRAGTSRLPPSVGPKRHR